MKGDYANGKIYRIEPICEHENNEVYYGSSSQLLSTRMGKHRGSYKLWQNGKATKSTVYNIFDKYGVENCRIYLVEAYPCNSKEELLAQEGYYIKNNPCVNKTIPCRTYAEYYQDNKEKIILSKKAYRANNKEKLILFKKEYYQKNKEKLTMERKEKDVCDCGVTYSHHHKARHFKSLKHQKYQKMLDELDILNKMHHEMMERHKNMPKF